MISQNYPMWVAWVDALSKIRPDDESDAKGAEAILRFTCSGRVIGWWTVPGHVTTELVPVVAGPDNGRAFPVSEEGACFFYGDTQAEAITGAMNYQLRDTGAVWTG
jgi:hypothetical protein